MYLVFVFLGIGCSSTSEKKQEVTEDSSEFMEEAPLNTVIFPLISLQGNMSSLNFFVGFSKWAHEIYSENSVNSLFAHNGIFTNAHEIFWNVSESFSNDLITE